jgi:predicted lipid-binding transport protein (Tim44 family)
MASWVEAARVEAPARRQRQAPPRARAQPSPKPRQKQRGVAGGMVWIAAMGILLAGVVALNVAVLRLNVRLDQVTEQRAKLRAENAALASRLSSAAASPRIQILATRQGFVPAEPAQTTYVELGRRAR